MAIRTVPAGRGSGAHNHAAVTASAHTSSPATAGSRAAGRAISSASAVFTATISRLTSHTPPTEASRSAGGTCHWLAPRSPHGPPKYSQDRTSSTISQPEGTSTSAAAHRPAPGAPPSSARTSSPQGAQSAPSSRASTRMKTCRLGSSHW
jgi:hypothetical protein